MWAGFNEQGHPADGSWEVGGCPFQCFLWEFPLRGRCISGTDRAEDSVPRDHLDGGM